MKRMGMILRRGLAILGVLVLTGLLADASAESHTRRIFQPGERWTYRVMWGAINAGDLVMEVLPMATVDGVEAYHFVMDTKTNSVVDWIYKVRERQESFVDTAVTHSLLYKKKSEGKHPRDVIVQFDWSAMRVVRSNFGEKMAPVTLVPGTFDSLALFYAIRCHDLKQNGSIRIPVSDGDNLIMVQARIGKRERLEIAGRTYDTLEVTPDMRRLEAQAVVKKGQVPEMTIWFTDDDRKIPVKIRSKVVIGYFVFELISVSFP